MRRPQRLRTIDKLHYREFAMPANELRRFLVRAIDPE
jgi:hypothetical protein